MKKIGLFLLAVVMMAGLVGCSSDEDGGIIEGTWNLYSHGAQMGTMDLNQSGQYVTGSFSSSGPTGLIAGTIEGTSVSLLINGYGLNNWILYGTVNGAGTVMSGNYSASWGTGSWEATKK